MRKRVAFLVVAVALIAAACGAVGDDDSSAVGSAVGSEAPSSSTVTTLDAPSQVAAVTGELPEGPSALDNKLDASFPDPLIDPADILSGGPPPDGIPPVDDPQFVTVAQADAWLNDPEPVLVVDVDGDVRAYPIQILMWHEIVNDTVGGVPLSVTYCPLCNSAITFERTVRGVETTFGTSGSLYFANLVMYDRATESLWNQLDGRAVVGLLTGEVLNQIPSSMVAWRDFKEARPEAMVLDRERTGASRPYGTNPYTGLDDPNGQPFLFQGDIDVRAKAMQRVVAIETESEAVAWALDGLVAGEAAVTDGEIDGDPLVIFWKAGQASALEQSDIAAGRDIGTVGVFSSVFDGQALTFRAAGDVFIDAETGTTWNVLGDAIDGPLVGGALEPITFVRTFWFSWAAFRSDTDLIEG
ncbi:MAG: DUF3179 domain-containing protein [Acidimicrobiia bacterium]|nr:MAG: DUF3179 domain-containing protein [Acidimicrobiia bacterium]